MLTNIQTKSRVGWKGSLGALIALVVIAIAGARRRARSGSGRPGAAAKGAGARPAPPTCASMQETPLYPPFPWPAARPPPPGSWILMAQISELVNARRDLADIGDISKAQAEDEFTTEDPAAAPAKVAMNAGDDVEAAAADQVAKP